MSASADYRVALAALGGTVCPRRAFKPPALSARCGRQAKEDNERWEVCRIRDYDSLEYRCRMCRATKSIGVSWNVRGGKTGVFDAKCMIDFSRASVDVAHSLEAAVQEANPFSPWASTWKMCCER